MKAHERLQQEPFFLVAELPTRPPQIKPEQLRYIPTRLQLQTDGSYKAVEWQVAAYASVHEAAKKTGVPRRVLMRLAKCGLITMFSPSPFLHFVYYDEIEKFTRKVEANPRFWDSIKTRAYLQGDTIQTAITRR